MPVAALDKLNPGGDARAVAEAWLRTLFGGRP